MENAVTAEYLTIHYRLEAGPIVVGIALYVASTDSLYITFGMMFAWMMLVISSSLAK